VPYRQIPQHQHADALSLLARHTVEWVSLALPLLSLDAVGFFGARCPLLVLLRRARVAFALVVLEIPSHPNREDGGRQANDGGQVHPLQQG
jgi:hypothetical protein